MSKITARKIKMPLWQNIVYLIFIAVVPIIITCIELFNSHSTVFQITFSSVGAMLISIIVIKKFLLSSNIKKLEKEIFALEHDYSIAVGNDKLTIAKWKRCKLVLFIYNAIIILISIILLTLFVTALSNGLIAFKGAILTILLSVFIGLVFKVICYISSVFEKEQDNEET